MTTQPKRKFVANLGDKSPLDYGGLFVWIDETGVYPPELEKVELLDEDDERSGLEVRRVLLERCTFINGILSDNKFHPSKPAWFAKSEEEKANRPQDSTYLSCICESMDVQPDELIRLLCSADPVELAEGYRCVLDFHGWENGDSYPLTLTRSEAKRRYRSILAKC